jgi:hypothetical protein
MTDIGKRERQYVVPDRVPVPDHVPDDFPAADPACPDPDLVPA